MAKQLTITDSATGDKYVLEFNRKSVEMLERQGFTAEDVVRKPVTCLPMLFAGAFLMHNRAMKREAIDAIYAKTSNRQALIEKLVEMYNEPILSLVDEPESNEGNADWTASW